MASKYKAKKIEVDGEKYDSMLEYQYYEEVIKPKIESGEIKSFERQVPFELQPGFVYQGQNIRPINYVADYVIHYTDPERNDLVVDVKGFGEVQVAKMKRKMMYYKYNDIDFRWMTRNLKRSIDGTGWIEYDVLQKIKRDEKKEKMKNGR